MLKGILFLCVFKKLQGIIEFIMISESIEVDTFITTDHMVNWRAVALYLWVIGSGKPEILKEMNTVHLSSDSLL